MNPTAFENVFSIMGAHHLKKWKWSMIEKLGLEILKVSHMGLLSKVSFCPVYSVHCVLLLCPGYA